VIDLGYVGLDGNDTISGSGGDDTIEGNGGDDTLFGDAGNDWLDGGTGIDLMTGGDGNDSYMVDSPLDTVVELATGGHNAGIVSEPGRDGRHHQVMTKNAEDRYVDPETWVAIAPQRDGSWWPTLAAWLASRSEGGQVPPPMGQPSAGLAPLCDAPGTYVLQD